MVAERDDIVADGRHRLVFDHAAIKIEIGRALKRIARVQKQSVRVLGSDALDERGAAGDSALASVSVVGRKRINLRVLIVRMKNRNQHLVFARSKKRGGKLRERVCVAEENLC